MTHPLMAARQAGVRLPENQRTSQAEPMTVTKAVRLELALVEWADERGNLHNSAAVLAGDKVFVNEQWTSAFRSMVEAMAKQVFDKLSDQDAAKTAAVPQNDTVDVVDEKSKVVGGETGIDVFDAPAPKKGK